MTNSLVKLERIMMKFHAKCNQLHTKRKQKLITTYNGNAVTCNELPVVYQ